jgi:hypothetical protein
MTDTNSTDNVHATDEPTVVTPDNVHATTEPLTGKNPIAPSETGDATTDNVHATDEPV